MLKILVKKQLFEIFRNYFYDAKKNKARSKVGTIIWLIVYVLIMIGILGGIFTILSLSLCKGLHEAGLDWLYFVLMALIAMALGAFGSVFNTYSGLYLSKDNDLLLSLPIPEKTIVASRLVNVYLLGVIYSAVVFVPAQLVYWIVASHRLSVIFCSIWQYIIISLMVLVISCLLGWLVAKISQKIKHKSFISVLASLLFMGAYWFFYARANTLLSELLSHANMYGEKIQNDAYALYLFGKMGTGDYWAALIYTGISAILVTLTWLLLIKSFVSLVTSSGKNNKAHYVEKEGKEKSIFLAFVVKELQRFTSSPNYMLNCGLGIVLLPVVSIILLIVPKFSQTLWILETTTNIPDVVVILLCALIMAMISTIDIAAPSISLEGKNLWIPQSLPVQPQTVLLAKAGVQFILSVIPSLIASICMMFVVQTGIGVKVFLFLLPIIYCAFYALFNITIALQKPNMDWTNELYPTKQSAAVAIALFGSWGLVIAFVALYMGLAYRLGALYYMMLVLAVLIGAILLLWHWLMIKGAKAFQNL